MKYNFHIGMCVCVTTCFLYVTDAVSVTTVVDKCGNYTTEAACNAASGCSWAESSSGSGICLSGIEMPDVVIPDNGVNLEAVTCSPKVVAMPADSANCHANPYYLVTQPDSLFLQFGLGCTYDDNVPNVACYPGYYYYENTDSCKPCPEGFTSADKNMNGVADCFRVADESYENDMGYFSYSSACYCDEDCEDGVSPESSDGC